MSGERKLIAENERGRVSLYRRPESGDVFYYEIRIGNRKIRRSTGHSDEATAAAIAEAEFADAAGRAERGIDPGKLNIIHYVAEFLRWREERHVEGYISEATVYNDRMYLRGNLQPYVEARNLKELQSINLGDWLEWRKSSQAARDRDHSYQREGRMVRGKRAGTHFKPPKMTTLQKELGTFKVFFKFCVERGWLTTLPVVPELQSKKVQTIKRVRGLKSNGPVVITHEDDAGHEWITVPEYRLFRRAAVRNWKAEKKSYELALVKYPHIYEKRRATYGNPLGYPDRLVASWSFLFWTIIQVNAGMRPVECRTLTWRNVLPWTFSDGAEGVVLYVHGKGKTREVVLPKSVAVYAKRLCHLTTGKLFSEVHGSDLEDYYVFPVQDYRKIIRKVAKLAGIKKDISQYSFRHTFINWQLMYTSTSHEDLATMAGTSAEVIWRHYYQITPFIQHERRAKIVGPYFET
ncbi:MAG: hypothetical protein VR70_05330 [Rhodospirillaceae bacterium BRH_c57]|nr:MAG: hypothetical protein VR70_05330 [Rhodospirillaceae bacterium BRH_c57]